ncbi:hypothetical protein PR202_gb06933 [Eleusine coracana subsp. coracana]|uniref:Uncharacterized protein n=1 Tax=Eleusine coracana subsp. coracana TaxID=191504 RepID=A0AAV5EA60_ELECO|nr:hypothetical protein PR202_gb06933 [Eleusine coracana subsp. coracana]
MRRVGRRNSRDVLGKAPKSAPPFTLHAEDRDAASIHGDGQEKIALPARGGVGAGDVLLGGEGPVAVGGDGTRGDRAAGRGRSSGRRRSLRTGMELEEEDGIHGRRMRSTGGEAGSRLEVMDGIHGQGGGIALRGDVRDPRA